LHYSLAVLNVLRGVTLITLFTLNLFFWGTPLILISLLKFLVPTPQLRGRIVKGLVWLAERWSYCNSALMKFFLPTQWSIDGDIPHDRLGHFLLMSNHRSWVDIIAIYHLFNGRIPFIRFFLKRELLWMPVVGLACWAIDFPFMKRYSPEFLEKHPEKRGEDLETTRRACRRYRHMPVTVLNFLEGTRMTETKRCDEESPYRHLLRPRVGGIAYVFATLGDQLDGIYDITLAYPGEEITFWHWASGQVPRIAVRIRRVEVPNEFFSAAATEPGPARDALKRWLDALWREKDEWLEGVALTPVARENVTT
jgi:1-acyl-sn-glycerol-3-phosphate acyltransferase